MTTHVMIDLWTLGKGPEGAIVAIGAIKFDPFKPKAKLEQFFQSIDPVSSQALGMKLDASAVMWFLGLEMATKEFQSRRIVDLATGLYGLSDWMGTGVVIWGTGDSDVAGLRRAYELIGDEAPWNVFAERDTKTIEALVKDLETSSRTDDPLLEATGHKVDAIQKVVKTLGLTRL